MTAAETEILHGDVVAHTANKRSEPLRIGPEIVWRESCVSINVPQQTRGRVWIDRFGGDVLRIDETVLGPFDIRVPEEQRRKGAVPTLTLDRADSSIRYRTVTFADPNEIVLLPESIEMMTVIRGSGAPRGNRNARKHGCSVQARLRLQESAGAQRRGRSDARKASS